MVRWEPVSPPNRSEHEWTRARELRVRLYSCDVALPIALRRIIMSRVETVAFGFDVYDTEKQDIRVLRNTGALHNEWLCHRVSLVPIHFTAQQIRDFRAEDYEFALHAVADGPTNVDVTTKDFVVTHKGKKSGSDADLLFPADPITGDHVLITRLRWSTHAVKEEIELSCTARKGCGRDHARWSPVSKCTYSFVVDQEAAAAARAAIDATDEDALHKFDTLGVQRCFVRNAHGAPDAFELSVESECGLSGYEIVAEALRILEADLRGLLDGGDVTFQVPDDTDPEFVLCHLHAHDHTMGAFLQALVYELFMRGQQDSERRVTFVGYHKPHPLQEGVVLKLRHSMSRDHRHALATLLRATLDWLAPIAAEFHALASHAEHGS